MTTTEPIHNNLDVTFVTYGELKVEQENAITDAVVALLEAIDGVDFVDSITIGPL
jgi:hypothetical protein